MSNKQNIEESEIMEQSQEMSMAQKEKITIKGVAKKAGKFVGIAALGIGSFFLGRLWESRKYYDEDEDEQEVEYEIVDDEFED